MEIKRDDLKIGTAPVDVTGTPLEPEQAPAERILGMDLPLTAGGVVVSRGVPGQVSVAIEGVGELATNFRKRCALCKYFDHPYGQKVLQNMRDTKDPGWASMLEKYRAAVGASLEEYEDQDEADRALDLAMSNLGLCRAITEIFSKYESEANYKFHPAFVMPEGGCPEEFGPGGEWLGELFKPSGRAAEKSGSQSYDRVLRAAQVAQGRKR